MIMYDATCLFQLLLSAEDLKMMMDEVSDRQAISMSFEAGENPTEAGVVRSVANSTGLGTVNLKTFLLIMEKSVW